MAKKYYYQYKLLKDTPSFGAGWPLKWDGTRRKYYFPKVSSWGFDKGEPDISLDYNGQSFSLEEVENKPDWFEPIGKPKRYIPAFPSPTALEEYVYLRFENRLVDGVDECRALSDLWNDDNFQKNLYKFVKTEYEKLHKLIPLKAK